MKNILGVVVFFLCMSAGAETLFTRPATEAVMRSPDQRIVVAFQIKDNRLFYRVSFNGSEVIELSRMGLQIDNEAIGKSVSFGSFKTTEFKETYVTRGIHSLATNHCNRAEIPVMGPGNQLSFQLEVRAYNDGVSFRYRVRRKGGGIIEADSTEFTIPARSMVWSQDKISDYEGNYQQQLAEEVKEGQRAGPPLTIKLAGERGYMALTEAGVIDFAGMYLVATGGRKFSTRLAGAVKAGGDIVTPWRIIMIGSNLNALVNNEIINNVSPAADKVLFPEGPNTNWIRPGKSVWSWLADNGKVTLDNMKNYSRWAGQLGFEYNLVDDGWELWQEGKRDSWDLLKELVDYSDSQHVKIWVWRNYQDRPGVPGIKNDTIRHKFFEKCRALGVTGVKIDFLGSEKQEVMNFYRKALEEAAHLQLMLDFHGADKPTGLSRTYPNEMTREGVRGLEYANIAGPTNWPLLNTTLPFTRFLAGPADYTPLSFNNLARGTTWAHQVATLVVYTSPFMCMAANPETLLSNPCAEMVQELPVTWDETIVLSPSEIGKLALFARRKGNIWYLAALNGEGEKEIDVKLSFLGPASYKTRFLEDAANKAEQVVIRSGTEVNQKELTVRLRSGGGFVARFIPIP